MRFYWILPSIISLFLISTSAQAARLESWRFDSSENRLYITTDDGVQPTAQLLSNPTRLVIDLPGTSFGRPQMTQPVGGAVRAIRVGQFERNITRLVIELNSGYTLDPNQIIVRGQTANQWTVQIPEPQPSNAGSPRPLPSRQPQASAPRDNSQTTIESIELSGSQLLIRTDSPFTYSSGWDKNSGYFQITMPETRIGAGVKAPQINGLRVALQQADPNTAVIWVQPANGIQLKELNQPSNQILALQLDSYSSTSGNNYPNQTTPRIPSGRVSVVVDPGHGGGDVGAVGIGGIQEKDIVIDISLQVAQMLQQSGVQAILTRSDDREIDLEPRVQFAARVNATLFVSIHANAINMSRPDVNGIETYYYDSGIGLARTIHNSILSATGAPDRRVRQANFYVLRKTTMPAVLVEVGFVTGAQDAPRLADPNYRRVLAEAITRGILQYIQQNQ